LGLAQHADPQAVNSLDCQALRYGEQQKTTNLLRAD
jgi:hypothetical protein